MSVVVGPVINTAMEGISWRLIKQEGLVPDLRCLEQVKQDPGLDTIMQMVCVPGRS